MWGNLEISGEDWDLIFICPRNPYPAPNPEYESWLLSSLPPCRLISVPGVTENVRNSEDCIWVTIMLTNGKPIKACSLQRWPSLQTSNVFNIFQLIFNNGCQQAQHSDFLFTSLRIKPTSFQKWNNLWPFKLNSHPPSSWYCRELCSRVQLWFIFWHYRFFSSPRPSFLFTLCSGASVRSDTQREI